MQPKLGSQMPLFLNNSVLNQVVVHRENVTVVILAGVAQVRGLSSGIRTERLPVQFPVGAHAWVVGLVPSRGRVRGNHTLMLLSSLSPSLPLSLKIKN